MKQSIPRLRSVRFKSGGYLRLMRPKRVDVSRELRQQADDAVIRCWETFPDKMAGFALIVWATDGEIGGVVKFAETSPYLAPTVPGIMADEVRRILTLTQINRALGNDEHDNSA